MINKILLFATIILLPIVTSAQMMEEKKEEKQSLATLTKTLAESSDSRKRQKAAFKIGKHYRGDNATVSPLLKALDDDHWGVRANAAVALSKIGTKRSKNIVKTKVIPLFTKTISSKDPAVREISAHVLGKLGKKAQGSFTHISKALADEEVEVRTMAAFALGQIRHEESPKQLKRALDDESWQVRQMAARALGKLKNPKTIPWLTAALDDRFQPVRWDATVALTKLGEPAVPALVKAMNDEDDAIQKAALKALETIDSPQAAQAIVAYKKKLEENEDWFVSDSDE